MKECKNGWKNGLIPFQLITRIHKSGSQSLVYRAALIRSQTIFFVVSELHLDSLCHNLQRLYIANKIVIHIQMFIVLKSLDLPVAYMSRATHPLSIGTILASRVSHLTEYIAIEDDNVISHFHTHQP